MPACFADEVLLFFCLLSSVLVLVPVPEFEFQSILNSLPCHNFAACSLLSCLWVGIVTKGVATHAGIDCTEW